MNRLVVFVGAHSSGKTTLGKMLAARLGWRFEEEIGYRLRLEVLQSDPTQLADVQQTEFDRRVCFEECQRDHARDGHAVIETWHGGNLAYIRQRSPEIYLSIYQDILIHLAQMDADVIVVPLQIQLSTLKKRQHEAVSDVQFFHRVGEMAKLQSEACQLFVVEPVITDDGRSPEECVEEILEKISRGY